MILMLTVDKGDDTDVDTWQGWWYWWSQHWCRHFCWHLHTFLLSSGCLQPLSSVTSHHDHIHKSLQFWNHHNNLSHHITSLKIGKLQDKQVKTRGERYVPRRENLFFFCNFASGKGFKMIIIKHHLCHLGKSSNEKVAKRSQMIQRLIWKELQNPRTLSGKTTHYKIYRVHLPEWHGYWLDTLWILTIVGPDIAFTKLNWQCVQKGLPAIISL